jgi:hypothetical protein
MAIDPGTDLLSDALLAADPQRAGAAAARLANLAAADVSGVPAFETMLAAAPRASGTAAPQLTAALATTQGQPAPRSSPRQNPYEQFETVMLKSLFELMLPEHADAVFGSGFAGGMWKSMFAQALAEGAGHGKLGPLARSLEAHARRAKS